MPVPRCKTRFPLLPKSTPIDLEIGAGTGMFALRYTLEHPDRHLISIEQTQTRFQKLQNQLNQTPRPNLTPVHANALGWVTHFVPPNSLENIFILFPNPNPKKSDLNKRWHAMPFMKKLLDSLQSQGKIHLATNEEFYFEEARHYFSEAWNLRIESEQIFQAGDSDCPEPRTLFEKKYLERGQKIYNLCVTL